MKKSSIRAKLFSLAFIVAGTTTTISVFKPFNIRAEDVSLTQDYSNLYEIVRNINIFYVNDDGSTTFAGNAPYKGYVSSKSMKFTFQDIKVMDLFKDTLGYWKPDKDIVPAVIATYDNPPSDVNVFKKWQNQMG